MRARRFAALAVLASAISPVAPASAGQTLTMVLQETGQREYYCTATFQMRGGDEAPYRDVNGYFYIFVGDKQVGRSKGASFLFGDGGSAASATFETPNAPCAEVDGYVFVVGACMLGNGFADRNRCAADIAPGGVVRQVRAR